MAEIGQILEVVLCQRSMCHNFLLHLLGKKQRVRIVYSYVCIRTYIHTGVDPCARKNLSSKPCCSSIEEANERKLCEHAHPVVIVVQK